ncbi:MAG TPA: DUF2752 domain-containing protein [Pyrinomonadaceae bacterium]|jgi:hypothetical protein
MQAALNQSEAGSTPARWQSWVLFVGLTAIFAVSALWRPSDDGTILCLFRALTGYPCPGCGMTRAFSAIAHGELWRAVRYNPFSPLLFLAGVAVWASAAATLLHWHGARAALSRLRPSGLLANVLLLMVMLWWITRLAIGI